MRISKKSETVTIMATTDYPSDRNRSVIELDIEKIISNGCGLARYSGRAVFIPFTVPGEKVLVEIDLEGKKFLEGKLLEIIKPSPDRVNPVCPLFGRCGGCSFQHISYEKQLEIKKELVSEAFRRNGKLEIPEPEIISGEPYRYRCRIQVHPSDENRGRPGFKERGGNRVIVADSCPVCTDGINSFLSSEDNRISERTVVFSPDGSSYYLSSGGPGRVTVRLDNLVLETDPSSFFQSNIPLFVKAVDEIKKYAAGDTLLDLYSGAAVFGSALSGRFKQITSVEENKIALKLGEKNIPDRNDLKKHFFPLTVEEYIKKQSLKSRNNNRDDFKESRGCSGKTKSPGKMLKKQFDTVIADPPRTGLSKQVRSYLKMLKPEVFIYLSCDYTTMARDLGDLTDECYNLDIVKIFDFYPQTPHAETLAVLSRKK